MGAAHNKFGKDSGLSQSCRRSFITVMVRDPYCLYGYWEIIPCDTAPGQTQTVLRVYDITGVVFYGSNANHYFDVGIAEGEISKYIQLQEAGRTLRVEIGYKTAGGFRPLACSAPVTTPVSAPSTTIDPDWPISNDDFQELYALCSGWEGDSSYIPPDKPEPKKLKNLEMY